MAKIAITGAGGRLGKWFISQPEWQEHTIVPVSRVPESATSINLDQLTDPKTIGSVDTLLHLAWSSLPSVAEREPEKTETIDLPLLEKILGAAGDSLAEREHPLHLVFVSTGAVYGNAINPSGSVETDEPHPLGEYAKGKLRAEQLIRVAESRGIISASVLRVANAYGFPNSGEKPQGVIPHLIRAALDSTAFQRWGGDHEKDYLHITDLSRALLRTIDLRLDGTYNISSNKSLRLSEIIFLIEQITGKAILQEEGAALDWDVASNRLSARKFMDRAHWTPEVPFIEGVAKLVAEMS